MSYVSNEIRDKVMEKVLAEPSNRLCFDCNSKEPKWSSPYLGIILCYDCAARHRSYGTHISFVRSVDLDKWNKKQLKSLEISGNSYTKERFNEMGIPKIGNIYDYNNDLVLKFRAELAEKVKEELENENEEANDKNDEKKNDDKNENININNEVESHKNDDNNNEVVQEVKNEVEKPTKFEINKNVKLNNIKIEGKGGKKNKIKKVDFDFNFDSFDTMNFSDFNKKNNDEEEAENNNNKMTLKEQLENESKKQKEENRKIYGNTKSYDFKYSEEEINKKFANKKAISSEDYAALEDDGTNDNMIKNKIKSMGNSQAISSDDIYGTSDDYAEETFGDKLKDFAVNFTLKAAEKAKEYKNKANEYINKIQNKLGGSG